MSIKHSLSLLSLSLLSLSFLMTPSIRVSHAAPPTKASASAQRAASKPIKRLINAIRYNKDALALKSFDGEAQGELLFGALWTQQPAAERARFVKTLHDFFSVVAFPKLRADFEHLETILYGEPQPGQEGELKLRATIVVLHALKKDEVPVDFLLKRQPKGELLISDFWIAPRDASAPSFLTRLKQDQVGPLLKKEGWSGLLSAMERRVAELKKR